MRLKQVLLNSVALVFAAALAGAPTLGFAQTPAAATSPMPDGKITGVVTGANGPEAGVWVIAETSDLPTHFIKIVVTDDQGRYLLPQLPPAHYKIFARGYGLVDSDRSDAQPGATVDIVAKPAQDAAAAAHYYPAIFWFAMLDMPDKSLFPGTGPQGNHMPKTMKTQGVWIDNIKTNGCVGCHTLGEESTRTIPSALGAFKTPADAWERRIQSGQAMSTMTDLIGHFDTRRALNLFGDWTDRIAKGELPFAKPERPKGLERNVVLTLWDWGSATSYLHDEISTDRRQPTINAYGKIYGSPEFSTDNFPVLDPVTTHRDDDEG